jgi:hypothetical protein
MSECPLKPVHGIVFKDHVVLREDYRRGLKMKFSRHSACLNTTPCLKGKVVDSAVFSRPAFFIVVY